jgi:hypothetical protein
VADYYPLIEGAVAALSPNTIETRRALYDRARAVQLNELKNHPYIKKDYDGERLMLEDAISRVEQSCSASASQILAAKDTTFSPAKASRALTAVLFSRAASGLQVRFANRSSFSPVRVARALATGLFSRAASALQILFAKRSTFSPVRVDRALAAALFSRASSASQILARSTFGPVRLARPLAAALFSRVAEIRRAALWLLSIFVWYRAAESHSIEFMRIFSGILCVFGPPVIYMYIRAISEMDERKREYKALANKFYGSLDEQWAACKEGVMPRLLSTGEDIPEAYTAWLKERRAAHGEPLSKRINENMRRRVPDLLVDELCKFFEGAAFHR